MCHGSSTTSSDSSVATQVRKAGERSKPPSVRPGIRLSVRAVPRKPRDVRATTARTCTGEGSPFHRSSAVRVQSIAPACSTARAVSLGRGSRVGDASNRARDSWIRTTRYRLHSLCGLSPLPFGRVRAHHRSGRDVSFLFQSQRSPAPDLRPVTCPNRWGDFPRGRDTSRRMNHVGRGTVSGTSVAAARLSLPPFLSPSAE